MDGFKERYKGDVSTVLIYKKVVSSFLFSGLVMSKKYVLNLDLRNCKYIFIMLTIFVTYLNMLDVSYPT